MAILHALAPLTSFKWLSFCRNPKICRSGGICNQFRGPWSAFSMFSMIGHTDWAFHFLQVHFLIHVQTSQMHSKAACHLQMVFLKMHFNYPAALLFVFVVGIPRSSFSRRCVIFWAAHSKKGLCSAWLLERHFVGVHPAKKCKMACYKMKDQNVLIYIRKITVNQLLQNDFSHPWLEKIDIKRY